VGRWADEAARGSTCTLSFHPAIIRGAMERLETLTQAHAARLSNTARRGADAAYSALPAVEFQGKLIVR